MSPYINQALVQHLTVAKLLTDKQYGFRQARSTADILTVVSERIYRSLDKTGEGRAVALDISKAFDRVWHDGLLRKIRSYGITGRIHNVIKSFLSKRKIQVVLDGRTSKQYDINAGVPQGSILGPLLFLIFINDLPDKIVSEMGIFADDTTLYNRHEGKTNEHISKEMAETLEDDLQSVVEWGQKWMVTFNAAKTKLVSFNNYKKPSLPPIAMAKNTLPESTSFKLLGLTFTGNMNWNRYIESIAKAAAKKVGSLYRARKLLTPESILYLYKATIRPCMEYCCHIWAGASAACLSLLDRVQKRVANLIGPELSSKLQPLSHRRNVASLCLFYKYFNGGCSDELQALVPPRRDYPRQTRQALSPTPLQ